MATATCIRKPATIRLNRAELQDRIDKIFEKATHQNECLINIYKIVLPDWDNIGSPSFSVVDKIIIL